MPAPDPMSGEDSPLLILPSPESESRLDGRHYAGSAAPGPPTGWERWSGRVQQFFVPVPEEPAPVAPRVASAPPQANRPYVALPITQSRRSTRDPVTLGLPDFTGLDPSSGDGTWSASQQPTPAPEDELSAAAAVSEWNARAPVTVEPWPFHVYGAGRTAAGRDVHRD
ncbi:MAG: hypothetical protein ACREIV_11120 [Planctomycetaceae bacterium]